jgi:hypothetical protein
MGLPPAEDFPPRAPFLHLGTHPDSSPFWVHNELSGKDMLYNSNFPSSPSAEVREALMGFCIGDADALVLSTAQRVHLLGQSPDLNSFSWLIAAIMKQSSPVKLCSLGSIPHVHGRRWRIHILPNAPLHGDQSQSPLCGIIGVLYATEPTTNYTPVDTQIYPRQLDIHKWFRHKG